MDAGQLVFYSILLAIFYFTISMGIIRFYYRKNGKELILKWYHYAILFALVLSISFFFVDLAYTGYLEEVEKNGFVFKLYR